MDAKYAVAKRTIRTVNAVLQIVIGLSGILFHTIQNMHGVPLDISHIACFFGVALSGQNTLTGGSGIIGGPLG